MWLGLISVDLCGMACLGFKDVVFVMRHASASDFLCGRGVFVMRKTWWVCGGPFLCLKLGVCVVYYTRLSFPTCVLGDLSVFHSWCHNVQISRSLNL